MADEQQEKDKKSCQEEGNDDPTMTKIGVDSTTGIVVEDDETSSSVKKLVSQDIDPQNNRRQTSSPDPCGGHNGWTSSLSLNLSLFNFNLLTSLKGDLRGIKF